MEAFSQENGILTPTMKVKRPVVKQYFWEHIEKMYEN
jgi:long-subunit acyl-CoA synthetase (AMP-forming)